MSQIIRCILLTHSIFLTGCLFHHHSIIPVENHISKETVVSGKVIKPSLLKHGGKLLVVPFSAGPDVEASEDLQKISFMIVKGIVETFKEEKTDFQILEAADAKKANVVIRGHITQRLKKAGFIKKSAMTLSAEGKLIDQKTGDYVLFFEAKKKAESSMEDERSLAEAIGREIGKFIITNYRD